LFGKYGAVRQIRVGTTKDTKGTAYVVYEDIYDAKAAQEHLGGFNVQNRYIVVLFYNSKKTFQKMSTKDQEEELRAMQEKYGVDGQQHSTKE
jgi:pre-mRNA branch site protein p14